MVSPYRLRLIVTHKRKKIKGLKVDHLCYLCRVFVMFLRLFITALWSTTGKELTSWLLFVMYNCDFDTFPCGILGQVWNLIVLIPDLYRLSYF